MHFKLNFLAMIVVWLSPHAVHSQSSSKVVSAKKAVSGPNEPMSKALAGGATATYTLKPVPPKTVPPSSYPEGTVINGTTISLGEVPARVWFEFQVTGWAPDNLHLFHVGLDATDADLDGGGYDGDQADCFGAPAGGGDLFPAIVPCVGGTCQGDPSITCFRNFDCGANAPCLDAHTECRAALSGVTSPCGSVEASACVATRPPFFPPGGPVCEFIFFDRCDPEYAAIGQAHSIFTDTSTMNTRWEVHDSGNPCPCLADFAPSYGGTLVLDVPADAQGTYFIDYEESRCYMYTPGAALIPIAALIEAVIETPCCDCEVDADCDDDDACTDGVCVNACRCAYTPVAGWDPAVECCNPANGVQTPIPASSPCRVGGCSLGGSSGTPTFTELADGTNCVPEDRCNLPGQCEGGTCRGQQHAGSNCAKSRFISFDISTGSVPSAYRVRLASLHHPDPPYSGGVASDFSSLEGQVRWVGAPESYTESSIDPTSVHAAVAGCQPHYQDWSAIDLLHVGGSEIVPGSVYEVQSIAEGLDTNEESNFSAPVSIVTGRWADVINPYNPPSDTVQPDQADITAMVQKFRNLPFVISKPRSLMVGPGGSDIPELLNDVDFGQISAVVDAFRGVPYSFPAPDPCP